MILGKTDNGKEFTLPIEPNRRQSDRRYRELNREKLIAYHRNYRAAHPELKAKKRAYYKRNRHRWVRKLTEQQKARRRELWAQRRDSINAKRRAEYWANVDSARAAKRDHRNRNIERLRLAERHWRFENPEKYKACIAKSKAAKPDLYRLHGRRSRSARRSRMNGAPVEVVSIARLISRDRGNCHICGRFVGRKSLTLDHIIPVARNGAFAEWNLAIAHRRCNQRRSTRAIINPETREAAERYIASKGLD